ncbi:MAG: GTPase Era [Bacteroidia bacterium]|nr:GTPase Era [Bacteroidia bacterium]
MNHKAGFVCIAGKPNVGKSTLMNALMGVKLSIVTPKEQTTRHRIRGIINGEDYQIVFSDTPGIIKPHYLLHERMMDNVRASFADADLVLFVTDLVEDYSNEELVNVFLALKAPVIVAINKADLSMQDEINKLNSGWKKRLNPAAVIPVSAKENFNIEELKKVLVENLPEAPPFFPKEEITDLPERFFIAEIIREKIFRNYHREIPYSSEVAVIEFKDEGTLVKMRAEIYVERKSQKAIIIGHKGEALKKTATQARKDIEEFLGKKVFLEVYVRVEEDWRSHEKKLKRFGYDNSN